MTKNKTEGKKVKYEQDDSNSIVPIEIDTHFKLFGKHMWEVNYYDHCPLCEKKIDEFGYCACNACSG